MAALSALASFLEAAANEAACLAEQLAPSAPAAAAAGGAGLPADAAASPGAANKASPLPRAPSMSRLPLGRALRMAELGRVERLMADAAALLLNVVDAADLFAAVGRRNSGSGLGIARSGWSGSGTMASAAAPESSPAAPAGSATDAAAAFGGPAGQAATEQLSPITRLLLPAVAALGRWWRSRAVWSAAEAELANPQIHVDHLAQVRGRGGGEGHPGHRCKGLHLQGCHGTGHCWGQSITL